MSQQATENREWLRAKMDKAGLTERLMPAAAAVAGAMAPACAPWFENYARAYSEGHNTHHLHGRRLEHYASAYADICEEVDSLAPELELTLAAFWLQWDAGATYEGTEGEHWYFA